VIPLGAAAEAHVDGLIAHYERLERVEAIRNLMNALEAASERITRGTEPGLPAPRPYPSLTRPNVRWLKQGAYWIAFTREPDIIVQVFYAAANIPGRH
jgi:plasmid stabilization system protein ParE